ncbi:hypothetical protein G6F24_014906 [Rhizopus arrhizus]|nr:hypothetical protein G6F24_014906 [Rhizopus arrhizus]
MRSSLIGGLVANIRHNANRKQSRVRLFELGRVFMRDASVEDGPLEVAGVNQPMRLSGAAWGPAMEEQWGVPTRQVDFYDVKMDVEALFGARGRRLPPASNSTVARLAGSVNCTRVGRSKPIWRTRPWCSN